MIISLALALAAQTATAQPAPVAPPAARTQITAQIAASAIRPRLPQRFSPEFALVAAAAEGNVLVLTFEVAPAIMEGATPEVISAQLAAGFCANGAARNALEGPMSLRPDARSTGGQTMQGAVIERCPVAAPAAG